MIVTIDYLNKSRFAVHFPDCIVSLSTVKGVGILQRTYGTYMQMWMVTSVRVFRFTRTNNPVVGIKHVRKSYVLIGIFVPIKDFEGRRRVHAMMMMSVLYSLSAN